MSKKREKASVIFKIMTLILCTISLILNFEIAPVKNTFLYFTIISNVSCFIFYLIAAILYFTKKLKKNDAYYILKGMVTICITLTMAVYNMVLNGSSIYDGHMMACNFAHLVVPASVILDYIIFGEKGNLKYRYTLWWGGALIVYTIACWIFAFAGGVFADGSSYPYYYMNFEKYGVIRVLINCFVIYAVFMIYGLVVVTLDKRIGRDK